MHRTGSKVKILEESKNAEIQYQHGGHDSPPAALHLGFVFLALFLIPLLFIPLDGGGAVDCEPVHDKPAYPRHSGGSYKIERVFIAANNIVGVARRKEHGPLIFL